MPSETSIKRRALRARQHQLIQKFNQKFSKQEQDDLDEIINIEYKLTMAQEGHDCELN